MSVLAACALIALKVAAGIPSHSLGLLSEAAHSGIDLVAALLTFFADRPLFKVPDLRFFIARPTFADAFFEYFLAMTILPVAEK